VPAWILDLADRHIQANLLSAGPIAIPELRGFVPDRGTDRWFNVGTIFNISSSCSGDPDELAKAPSLPQTQAASLTQPNSPSMAGLRSLSSFKAALIVKGAEQRPSAQRSGKIMRRLLRARELGLPEGDLLTLEDTASAA
jgi:hypothetical protein